jgi:hypothetical protein
MNWMDRLPVDPSWQMVSMTPNEVAPTNVVSSTVSRLARTVHSYTTPLMFCVKKPVADVSSLIGSMGEAASDGKASESVKTAAPMSPVRVRRII